MRDRNSALAIDTDRARARGANGDMSIMMSTIRPVSGHVLNNMYARAEDPAIAHPRVFLVPSVERPAARRAQAAPMRPAEVGHSFVAPLFHT